MRIDYANNDPDRLKWVEASFANYLQEKLFIAFREAKRGKRATRDEQRFELNADENLMLLRWDLLDRTYTSSRGTAHIIHRPVMREIFAAPFRDRVVHHYIYDAVYDWWDRRFIYDSYSCREDKGTLMGIRRLNYHIRSVSRNYAEEVYILKLDIQGYFMSLPRKELYARALWGLEQQYAGRLDSSEFLLLKFLWHQIIFDDPVKGVVRKGRLSDWDILPSNKSLFCQEPGIGIVIGNLTSQLLSNIYLDMLDRFVVYDLGYKHYGRYVDDFYIVVREAELPQLLRDVRAIEMFLKGIKLTLHPHKRMLTTARRGVPFLGAMVHQGYILPGERLKRNFREACVKVQAGAKDVETLVSYLGHVEHFDRMKFLAHEFERIGLDYNY
ncbi:MAG: RNA-directed DNA polymerase [Candidatus Saccharibacteria bacterium]|nr:RNA-directed DNA polymerase [Candidatus Saccharibacteria bacterium]